MPKKSKIIEFPHLRALLGQDDANRAEDAAGKQASDSAPEPFKKLIDYGTRN